MAEPRRKMIGAMSRASGEMFERWIASACDFYQQAGYAVIEKTPEPMKPLGKADKFGRFQACFIKKAQPDFKGVLCDGSCIIFDAKHTEKDRIQQNVITEKQWEIFDKYEAMGAKCYVVVSIGFQSFFRVPWDIWKQMKELFGHKYMAVDNELKPYKVPEKNCTVLFLEGVELNDENSENGTGTEDK